MAWARGSLTWRMVAQPMDAGTSLGKESYPIRYHCTTVSRCACVCVVNIVWSSSVCLPGRHLDLWPCWVVSRRKLLVVSLSPSLPAQHLTLPSPFPQWNVKVWTANVTTAALLQPGAMNTIAYEALFHGRPYNATLAKDPPANAFPAHIQLSSYLVAYSPRPLPADSSSSSSSSDNGPAGAPHDDLPVWVAVLLVLLGVVVVGVGGIFLLRYLMAQSGSAAGSSEEGAPYSLYHGGDDDEYGGHEEQQGGMVMLGPWTGGDDEDDRDAAAAAAAPLPIVATPPTSLAARIRSQLQ